MASINLAELTKRFGDTETIHNVNLAIENGEFVVFVGPSGCGKSTLLRMIAGLEEITTGELKINGQVMNDVPPSQRGVAMVFQSYALYPHMSVRDNMGYSLKVKMPKAEIDKKSLSSLKRCNLKPYLIENPPNFLVANVNVLPLAARSFAIQKSFYSMNRYLTLMQNCALKCACTLLNCITT